MIERDRGDATKDDVFQDIRQKQVPGARILLEPVNVSSCFGYLQLNS